MPGQVIHEFIIDDTDLPLENHHAWGIDDTGESIIKTDEPCWVLSELGALCLEVTRRMNVLEPDDVNLIYIRFPIP